ncbi:DUF805 domain-containing protein [Micrococcus lylae]|uniref:DUF805 domain-containing protein n=1 Tax=Micrococcus lylae TaxID=1273 RepID=UPI0011AF0695|nr:DUF805 domain-containing protein [Micrococcus lylae]WIK82535.1 DUF805 domain-containing protein [Micrococcus lylae]
MSRPAPSRPAPPVRKVTAAVESAGTTSSGLPDQNIVGSLLMFVFTVAHILPMLGLAVRRLHDANMSGWLVLLGLIPAVGWIVMIVLLVMPPKPEGARYDS